MEGRRVPMHCVLAVAPVPTCVAYTSRAGHSPPGADENNFTVCWLCMLNVAPAMDVTNVLLVHAVGDTQGMTQGLTHAASQSLLLLGWLRNIDWHAHH